MYQDFKDRARFLMVYILEAHPSDEWQRKSNERDEVVFAQPTTLFERQTAATSCREDLGLTLPCVVDDMNNTADNAYAAWPERIVIVDRSDRVAYISKQGPWGFKINEARRALTRLLR